MVYAQLSSVLSGGDDREETLSSSLCACGDDTKVLVEITKGKTKRA